MSDIYCGSKKDVPKGKKRGSMKQCAETGEIRYYGIKKIDQKLVDAMEENKKKNASAKNKIASKKKSLEEAYITLAGKMKKLKDKIDAEKDKKEKVILQKELNLLEGKRAELKMEMAMLAKAKSSRQKGKSKSKSKSKSKLGRPKTKKSKPKSKSKSKSRSKNDEN